MTTPTKLLAILSLFVTFACAGQSQSEATPSVSPPEAQVQNHGSQIPHTELIVLIEDEETWTCPGLRVEMPTPPVGMVFHPTTDEEFAKYSDDWFDTNRTPFMSFPEDSFDGVSGSCTLDNCTRRHWGKYRVRGSYEATRWSSATGDAFGLLMGAAAGIAEKLSVQFDAGVSTHDLYVCGDGNGGITFMTRTADYQEPGKVLWRLCEFKYANNTVNGACGEMIAE